MLSLSETMRLMARPLRVNGRDPLRGNAGQLAHRTTESTRTLGSGGGCFAGRVHGLAM